MKKTLCLLLAVLLLASLSVTAFAVTDTDADSWTAPQCGFEMRIPDVFREAKGAIIFREAGEGMQPGSGVVSATGIYIAMPLEEYEALIAEQKEAYEIEDMEKVFELGDLASLAEWNLFTVYGINRGRGEKELRSIVTERALNPDYFGEDEDLLKTVSEFYEHMEFREIGEKDGVRYYLCFWDPDEYLTLHELTGAAQVDSVYKDEFIAVSEQVKMLVDTVTLTGQAAFADVAEAGTKLVFETTDLEGNPVSSDEIFSGHRITMINMWATWCDPCKNELPALAKMAEDFEKQGCQIIGLCLDAEDEETMAEGRAILEEAGVGYLNIVPFEDRETLLPNKHYPTTYFVDENGIVLDEVISGAMLTQYPRALEKLLNR